MKCKKSLGIVGLMFSRECVTPIAYPGTRSIHMMFMTYPIDILFIKNGIVVDKCENLKPWKVYKTEKRAIDLVVEHMSGKFKKINIGDNIDIEFL